MKRVWKCDHCSHTGTNKASVQEHEDGCTFNPINKTCYTCDNRVSGAYYDSSDECKVNDFSYFFDMNDHDEKICDDWTNKKERAIKLKQLKNKIK